MAVSIQTIFGMKLGIEFASAEEKELYEMAGGFVLSLLLIDLVVSW